ncbi:MFS general substrate transporter [Stipitochalara longipes BDJ]|nr:MFS general substrate transporter [Stipitochalara longipes BDJ]
MQLNNRNEVNPRNWGEKRKYAIAFFVLLSGFVSTMGTPIYFAGIPSIAKDLKISIEFATVPASLYPFGLGIGGLFGTASEIFGRRIVYQVCVPLSLLFTLVGGFAVNFPTLAAARFLAGLFAGSYTPVGVGVSNDLWDASLDKTGSTFAALSTFSIIYSALIGAMASSCIVANHSWRWKFWVTSFLLGIAAWAVIFIQEKRRATSNATNCVPSVFVWVRRPLHMTLTEPLILATGLVLSVTQSIIFAYYIIYYILFKSVYGFDEYQVGMAFSPVLVGMVLAAPVVALFDRLMYQKARVHAIKSGESVHPEIRLYPTMLSVILQPISLFWLEWTRVLFGFAYVLNMLGISIYNNEVYGTHFGASQSAATNFMRFTVLSAFPLFTARMVALTD